MQTKTTHNLISTSLTYEHIRVKGGYFFAQKSDFGSNGTVCRSHMGGCRVESDPFLACIRISQNRAIVPKRMLSASERRGNRSRCMAIPVSLSFSARNGGKSALADGKKTCADTSANDGRKLCCAFHALRCFIVSSADLFHNRDAKSTANDDAIAVDRCVTSADANHDLTWLCRPSESDPRTPLV